MARNRRTLSDADYVLRQSELEEQEQAIKNELKTYVIRYMKSITILLSDEYDERIRKIINKRDVHGNTPLHYAVNNWPQNIVKDMLKLGADLSIANKSDQIPLKLVPKDTLKMFLDEHCMFADGFDALDDDDYYYGTDGQKDDKKEDIEEDRFYKELLDDYDPRFMTNIGQSPIAFRYDLFSPTPYSNRSLLAKGKLTTEYTTPSEISVLSSICKSAKHRQLVTHPVIKSFVWLKWKLVSKCYNRNLRMNVLLVYFLTWYIFRQFGGLEYNSKCVGSDSFINPVNFTEFCDTSREQYKNLIGNHSYGELENWSIAKRWDHYLKNFGTKKGNCMYTDFFYIIYLIIFFILGSWILKDTIRDFLPNKKKNVSYFKEKFRCISSVLPFGMDMVNGFLMVLVVSLSERVLWVAISVIFLITLLTETTQLILSPRSHFGKFTNWMDLGRAILIAIILYVPNQVLLDPIYFSLHSTIEKVCPKPSDNSTTSQGEQNINMNDPNDVSVKRFLSSFLIVLLWTRFVFEIAKHPGKRTEVLNKYAMMYGKVASSFFKLLVCYCLFIIAFAVGFYISFHNDIGNSRLQIDSLTPYVFFESPFEAFIKTMAMFVGEVDFNNIPVGISYARRDGNISLVLGYVFLLTFIFMIIMVLMNLLNGLAVTDIAEIIRESEVLHQTSLINILEDFEDMAFTYKRGLNFIGNICTNLKRPLLTYFDVSQELLLFPTGSKSDLRREKFFKRQKILPFEDDEMETKKSTTKGWIKYFLGRHFEDDVNKGSDHILSGARDILINAKKLKMDQRASRKKQEKELEQAIEKTKMERQKTVALLKESVMDRLIPIVEDKKSVVHL